MFLCGECCSVIDNVSGNVVASGKISDLKTSTGIGERCYFISFDNRTFYNLESDRFSFRECELKVNGSVGENCKVSKWYGYRNSDKSDIIFENGYSDLDLEVKYLCEVLNQSLNPMAETIQSCSGHGLYELFVTLRFKDVKPLVFLQNIISKNDIFREKLVLHTDFRDNGPLDFPTLRLQTTEIGESAYRIANRFAEYLQLNS